AAARLCRECGPHPGAPERLFIREFLGLTPQATNCRPFGSRVKPIDELHVTDGRHDETTRACAGSVAPARGLRHVCLSVDSWGLHPRLRTADPSGLGS